MQAEGNPLEVFTKAQRQRRGLDLPRHKGNARFLPGAWLRFFRPPQWHGLIRGHWAGVEVADALESILMSAFVAA